MNRNRKSKLVLNFEKIKTLATDKLGSIRGGAALVGSPAVGSMQCDPTVGSLCVAGCV